MKDPEVNAFGHRIWRLREIIKDRAVRKVIDSAFPAVFLFQGATRRDARALAMKCLELASMLSQEEYEKAAHKFLRHCTKPEGISRRLAHRSQIEYKHVRRFAKGNVLDLGCGDGMVGKLMAGSHRVTLADVYEHAAIREHDLPFVRLRQNARLPFPNDAFGTTLLLTVLHHSENPQKTLQEAARVTAKGGRILVVESVFGLMGACSLRANAAPSRHF